MNQSTHSEPTAHTVSTVTKHIKIYSDNQIHDCIDRIINACVGVDEGGNDDFYHSIQLHEAAQDLLVLSCHLRREHTNKYRQEVYGTKQH